MTTTPLPPIPANTPHLTRRIRACESEVPAQVVLEHAMQAYAQQARADLEEENKRLREALEAMAHGCPPDCKDGSTDSGGTYPWGEAVLIRCPTCETFESITKELSQ